jgi:hypothetical protein
VKPRERADFLIGIVVFQNRFSLSPLFFNKVQEPAKMAGTHLCDPNGFLRRFQPIFVVILWVRLATLRVLFPS